MKRCEVHPVGRRFHLRLVLAVLGVSVLVAALGVCGGTAHAQAQLQLSDFDTTGLETDVLALIETGRSVDGNNITVYQASPRTPAIGSLLGGELGLGSSNEPITRIRISDTGSQVLINDSGPLGLRDFFQVNGADLTLRVQTAAGTGQASSFGDQGGNFAAFSMDADAQALLTALSDGDRLIIAFTRAATVVTPAQVAGVSAAAASDTSINVTWSAAARADGYRVEWGMTSGSYTDNATTASTSHVVSGLSANTTYYLRVVGTSADTADGTPSDEVQATTLQFPAPRQVSGVSAAPDDHDSVTVTWSAVADADGYVVQWDDDSAFSSSRQAVVASGLTVTRQITGLQEATQYWVRVYATRTGAADGPASSSATVTTALQAPGQVASLTASPVSDTEIRLTWDLALRAGGYRIEWGTTSGSYTDRATTTALAYTVSGLAADTGYYFRVTATRSGALDGAPSTERNARTHTAPPPGPVTGVSAVAISDREIRVTWNAEANSTGYGVQWDTDSAFPNPEQAIVSGTSVIIEDLRAGTEYFVQVFGTRAGAPDGTPSARASATTDLAQLNVWADRFPGNAVGAQLALAVFGGLMSGIRFRKMRTPQREALILLFMCGASLILPVIGIGNIFWTGGLALLVAAAAAAVFFLGSRA